MVYLNTSQAGSAMRKEIDVPHNRRKEIHRSHDGRKEIHNFFKLFCKKA